MRRGETLSRRKSWTWPAGTKAIPTDAIRTLGRPRRGSPLVSYYLLSLLKFIYETADHAGFHFDPVIKLVAIPVVVGSVVITILRVKHALKAES